MVQWFLSKLRQVHLTGRQDGNPYLSRYWLLGHRTSRWALMLHNMHRPDDDACHHDHPWSFWTLILKGGYIEEITGDDGLVWQTSNRPGRLLYRPATHTHRISKLPKGSCWTLVLRFKKERSWGFWTRLDPKMYFPARHWIPWRKFIAESKRGVLWCGEDE